MTDLYNIYCIKTDQVPDKVYISHARANRDLGQILAKYHQKHTKFCRGEITKKYPYLEILRSDTRIFPLECNIPKQRVKDLIKDYKSLYK